MVKNSIVTNEDIETDPTNLYPHSEILLKHLDNVSFALGIFVQHMISYH